MAPAECIDPVSTQKMFDQIRVRSDWNLDGPLLWGYFFLDRDRNKLEQARPVLEARGYRFITIMDPDHNDRDDDGTYYLHVEKVETHSVESLNRRNTELCELARKLDLTSYDGMDVGKVGSSFEKQLRDSGAQRTQGSP